MAFYVDSCIYINLWKNEVDFTGKKLYEITSNFLKMTESNNHTIYFSKFVLKELKFILGEDLFEIIKSTFNRSNFKEIICTREDQQKARKLESLSKFKIGFFDCIHLVLANKVNSILITRDNKLLAFAKPYFDVAKPEEFL